MRASPRRRSIKRIRNVSIYSTQAEQPNADPHHLVAAPNEDCDRPCVGALLNDEHLVARRAESEFANDTCTTKLLRGQVLKAGYYTAVGSDGDQLFKQISICYRG